MGEMNKNLAGAGEISRRDGGVCEISTPELPPRADTPCVAVCSTTFDEICRGCGRSVVEVAHWVSMTPEQKEVVWVRILAQGYPRRNT
jgi:predicted Fe-S protein YdhL (DUF1289 family)